MTFHKCSYCDRSYRSNDERKDHETVCLKNGKTEAERFKARQKLKEKRENE